jgi:hypothetical protein
VLQVDGVPTPGGPDLPGQQGGLPGFAPDLEPGGDLGQ